MINVLSPARIEPGAIIRDQVDWRQRHDGSQINIGAEMVLAHDYRYGCYFGDAIVGKIVTGAELFLQLSNRYAEPVQW